MYFYFDKYNINFDILLYKLLNWRYDNINKNK